MSNSLHIPVLLEQILQGLSPILTESAEPRYFDGTFGRGGHLKSILQIDERIRAVAFDRDPDAIAYGKQNFHSEISSEKLTLVHRPFSQFDFKEWGLFDAMLIDLGVSSPQLDQAERGFSFYHEGPLDMRMDTTQGATAADLINSLSEEDLIEVFKQYGEIQKPYRVVRAVVHDRKEQPYTTTRELASLIERVEGWRKKGFHPATQYFMALRLLVNQELQEVENALIPLIHGLKPRGRLAVLTFHSLEDRIVKNIFREREDLGRPVNKKVIQAEWQETKDNSRSRSAKLRIFERSGDESSE